MKKQTGIWLDAREAFLVRLIDGELDQVHHIKSDYDEGRIKGGSRSSTPWGPQDTTSETKILARKKHQLQEYFERIKDQVLDSQALFVFGPSEAKIGLEKAIREDKNFKPALLAVEPADQMTEKQLVAKVKVFFEKI